MKVEYVCAYCGGNEISRDTWADWDIQTQQWVLGAVFDCAHCPACDKETSIDQPEAKRASRQSQARSHNQPLSYTPCLLPSTGPSHPPSPPHHFRVNPPRRPATPPLLFHPPH